MKSSQLHSFPIFPLHPIQRTKQGSSSLGQLQDKEIQSSRDKMPPDHNAQGENQRLQPCTGENLIITISS